MSPKAKSPVSPAVPAAPSSISKALAGSPVAPPSISKAGSQSGAGKAKGKGKSTQTKKMEDCSWLQEAQYVRRGSPDSMFGLKGSICKEDETTVESLQRFLRKAFKKHYKSCMKVIKAKPGRWASAVVSFRARNQGAKRRVLGSATDTLKEVKGKMHKHRRVKQRQKFTFQKFARYYGSEEHGGYDDVTLRQKWAADTKGLEPCDHLGVEAGIKGHPRFRLHVEDDDPSFSESESIEGRIHEKSTKPKDDLENDDILDLLIWNGDTRLQRRYGTATRAGQYS